MLMAAYMPPTSRLLRMMNTSDSINTPASNPLFLSLLYYFVDKKAISFSFIEAANSGGNVSGFVALKRKLTLLSAYNLYVHVIVVVYG